MEVRPNQSQAAEDNLNKQHRGVLRFHRDRKCAQNSQFEILGCKCSTVPINILVLRDFRKTPITIIWKRFIFSGLE